MFVSEIFYHIKPDNIFLKIYLFSLHQKSIKTNIQLNYRMMMQLVAFTN